MKTTHPTTDPDFDLARAASTFAALGSEQRLTVLRTLVRAGLEGLSIGELGTRSGVTGSTLTHHMKILAQAGLVHQRKAGRSIICAAVAYEELRDLSGFLLRECCADAGAPSPKGTSDD
ncbi:MAG: ArsR/SmtB family transcription factor [Pseudooceanicola nanhaiensis]|uniref:ArsR/SmtB family transcription factor n=1 Tax=Pseudooceanicola nanhaiensis TaxID=375761 RepID=UPI00405A10D9